MGDTAEPGRRVADYFVMCGLPAPGGQQPLEEGSLEVNLKPSHNQDPITDITVIFPGLGENVPDYYQLLDMSPSGLPADLNHGSFRAPEVFLCFRRGRDRPPLVELGVLGDPRERISPGTQLVEFTPHGHIANVNNSTNTSTFITYRRAAELNPCNEFVIMDIAIVIASKGETPPHTFIKIDKSLNKGMVGSDVFLCYKRTMMRPDFISYKPGLLDRYPMTNNPTFTLDDTVALFCLPLGANMECWRAGTSNTDISKSTFVLTLGNAAKVYGSSISFYEEYDEALLTEEQRAQLRLDNYKSAGERRIMANKCICLLSQWPFFDAFEKFLFFIYKRLLMGPFEIPVERYISHFLYSVPFPSPERPRILVQLSPIDIIALYQPQELPLPRSGANFRVLVTTLGPENCLLLLLLALTEQKILVHSLRPDIVTLVCEAVKQIIFPFFWQCPYIPLCPIGMADYLSAPLPFVMGLDSRFFDQYDQPGDVNAVDLDTNTVSLCRAQRQLATKLLPKRAARTLKQSLAMLQEKCVQHNRLAQRLEMENDDSIDFEFKLRARESALELEIQEAFLVFMCSVLGGYRASLLPITRAPSAGVTDVGNLFDIPGFLRSRDKNYHLFYKLVMKTQMFTKFIEECSFVSDINTSLAFFDECVERVEREEGGRLLEGEGSVSDRTVFILPPDASDLPEGAEYRGATLNKFDHSLFKEMPLLGGTSDSSGGGEAAGADQFVTPQLSALARRTKQEIRSAVKIARKHAANPLLWAKCLLGSCYSIWFLHLPSMVLSSGGSMATLRSGHHLLERMQRLRLHPVDEICYRVMMQLCGLYSQPVLAVKVLFEMRRHGVHPNAVTYGHYNKAVLESEWPQGIASGSQLLWHKLRNVLTAVWLFKAAGRARRARDEDNLSLESGVSQTGLDLEVDTGPAEKDGQGGEAAEAKDENKTEEAGELGECRNSSGSHSDVGYSSMIEQAGVIEAEPAATEAGQGGAEARSMERSRSFSIVKPPPERKVSGEEAEAVLEEAEETLVADTGAGERPSVQEVWEEEAGPRAGPSYTDIRTKFPQLLSKTSGAARPLFRQESQESHLSDQVRGYIEGDPSGPSSRGGSEVRDLSEASAAAGSQESLEILDSLPDSPGKGRPALPTLVETPPLDTDRSSRAHLEKVPVTLDDPLGALSAQTTPSTTPAKDKELAESLPNGETLKIHDRSMSMSDVLGEPFSTPVTSRTPHHHMHRSSTMPLNSDGEAEAGTPPPGPATPGMFGSISSLAGSGMKSLASSRAAQRGLFRGKALLSSAWTSLSPASAQTSGRATKEALSSLRSGLTSAATNLSKRYEEMTAAAPPGTQSPAPAEAGGGHEAEDRVSQSSNDSRRQSEAVQVDGLPQDTWSTLTEALWNHLWGDNARAPPSTGQTQRAADITEQFETLYARAAAEAEENTRPVAMSVTMTTCSRCQKCGAMMFDEEIMAGWTADDSNLNTSCPFCERLTVPSLVTLVTDYRCSAAAPGQPDSAVPAHPLEPHPPVRHAPITVPYISPLVLRRELESILAKDGDACLNSAAFPDLHPIIYWNLLYCFHRIATPSHLPAAVLRCPSLNREEAGRVARPGWADSDHRNVRLVTRWDNSGLYTEDTMPLHVQWRRRNCATDPRVMHPLMQSVIKGVKENDLKYCVEAIIRERVRREDAASSPRGQSPLASPQQPRVLDNHSLNSVYRETLFLTLVSLGQDNIDLTAFDREYRRAFEKLRTKELSNTVACDRPPQMGALFCRKLFRELRI